MDVSKFQVCLEQTNSKDEKVFTAKANFNLPEDSAFESFGREIANFAKETLEFQQRSKKRGLHYQMIRKTAPTHITLSSLEEGDEFQVSLHFKNFGRFAAEQPEKVVADQLADSAEFVAKFSNWDK